MAKGKMRESTEKERETIHDLVIKNFANLTKERKMKIQAQEKGCSCSGKCDCYDLDGVGAYNLCQASGYAGYAAGSWYYSE